MPLDPCAREGYEQSKSFGIIMVWNSRDNQGAFLSNSPLKGNQRSLEATNSFLSITVE